MRVRDQLGHLGDLLPVRVPVGGGGLVLSAVLGVRAESSSVAAAVSQKTSMAMASLHGDSLSWMRELPNGCFQYGDGDQLLLIVLVVGFLTPRGLLSLDVVGLDGVQFQVPVSWKHLRPLLNH
jgi:hypothetical protein